jgi:hypothetical protein
MNENDSTPETEEGSDPTSLADEELAAASGGKASNADSIGILGKEVTPIQL